MRIVRLSDLSEKERNQVFKKQKEREDEMLNFQRQNQLEANSLHSSLSLLKDSGKYGLGNIDLNNRPKYKNEDGSISTVRPISFYDDKEQKEILIPTIAFNDKGNPTSLSDEEAIKKYYETGEYLGKFNDWKESNNYAKALQFQQENNLKKNEKINYKKPTNDFSAVFRNILLGAKRGGMAFKDSFDNAVSLEKNNKKMLDSLINEENKINEEMGLPSLPTYDESIKIILGEKKYNENKKIKDEKEEEWENKKRKTEEKIALNIDSTKSKFGRKMAELAPSIGQQIPGTLLPGAAGLLYFTGSAKGNYMDEAKARGMNEEDADVYSGIMALMEGATEKVGSSLTKGVGKHLAKGNGKEALKYFGLDIAENFFEEAVMEPISEFTATKTGGKETADWENIGQRMINSGIDGALTSIIMSGASAGVGKAVNVTDKIINKQKVTNKELVNAVNDTFKSDKINQEELKTKIRSETQNIINQNIETKNDNRNVFNENVDNKIQSLDNEYYNSAKNNKIDINNETVKTIYDVTSKREIKANYDSSIFKDNNVNAIWTSRIDENGNTIREVKINPNSDTNKTLQNIIVHELTHDLEGTKEYNNLKQVVLDYNKGNTGFEEAKKSLVDTYSTVYDKNSEDFNNIIDNEVVADILGSKLGNQEFVNTLVKQNNSIGHRIYSWVIDKLNKINKLTGYKSEKIYWNDVKNKFENAYRQDYAFENSEKKKIAPTKEDANIKYSIAGIKGMENAIKADSSNSVIRDSYLEAKRLKKNEVDNETIRKNTHWFQDKNGDWKFEITDKYMNLKKDINLESGKTYKLGNILKHDLLFTLYPELKNYDVKIYNSKNTNGSFIRKYNEIRLNEKLLNSNLDAEGTLIHEIQHAIQKIEKFEGGANSKNGKLRYYNSLGEIEAANTKERFVNEKYKNKDMSKIAPESSKSEPIHPKLYNYLENRKFIDKLKDNIYTKEKKNEKGANYEVSKEVIPQDNERNRSLVVGRGLQRYVEADSNNVKIPTNKKLKENSNKSSFNLSKNQENEKYSINEDKWQEYLDNNYKNNGKGQTIQDVKLPISKNEKINKEIEFLTDEDYSVLNEIYEKEGKTEILTEKKKTKILEKYASDKYKLQDSFDVLAQKWVNKGHYIDKLAEKTNNLELKYLYDRNLNSFAEGQYEVGVAQTNNEGKKIGKSINEIWKPIEDAKLTKEFSEYMLHKHNIDRSEKNKYVFGEEIGPAESTSIAMKLEKEHPEFKKYAKDIKNFNHNNLECLVDAGLLSKEMVDYLEAMYPNYVTISRDLQDKLYAGDKEKTGVNAPIKKAVGGNADIQPLKDTMAQQAIRIKRLINQNKLGQELSKVLKNAHVQEEGSIQLSPTMLMGLDTLVDYDNKGNKFYTYFENGELQKLRIDDNLYESLSPSELSKLEKTLPAKALQKVTSIHRSVLTSSNPIFIATNFFKDFQDGMFNSKYSSKFIKNYGKALNEIVNKGKYYESYMANGGMTNTYFDYSEGIKKQPNKFVEKIRNANEIVEQLPRMAEFISTLEDGKSLNEALYNAAEITTNFKRGGEKAKRWNRNGAEFLNASIQGFDKFYRNISGQKGAKGYVNLLLKATSLGVLPSILNHILLDDDEDYEKLPDSTKDLYYLFKYDDGKFARIPKGRVLSIFGSAARRTIESVKGSKEAWKGFGATVVNQIAPNNPLEDNILAPIIQVKNNKTWYGKDLVSKRLQKELPKNQYDETTDEFSKFLGSKLNLSPKKINYIIDQYSGGVGDVVLPLITPQAKENVFKDKFTTDSVLKNKYVSKFYETLEKQTQIANDSLATDEDQVKVKYLMGVSKEMGDLYKEKREIQMSKISNKEKREKVREIQSQINKIAEEALNNNSNNHQYNNSAKIGNETYYKNGKGEWQTISEEEQNKNTNISLETYSDYKQKVYEETKRQRDSGKIDKKEQIKQNDKIDILLNSNYSKKEKTEIYENYIKAEKDSEYKIMKYTNVDINEYLKYKKQKFKSDYEDDGTIKGKSISKSKKKKVYDYVNSSKMNYNQRLMLLGLQFELNTEEKNDMALFVNNLKIPSKKKLEIFQRLKGFKVYKNGRIEW